MNYSLKDIAEYIIYLVSEFAKKFDMSDSEAYKYIRNHKGMDYLEKHYGVLHTLSFDDVVDSVAKLCRMEGGRL